VLHVEYECRHMHALGHRSLCVAGRSTCRSVNCGDRAMGGHRTPQRVSYSISTRVRLSCPSRATPQLDESRCSVAHAPSPWIHLDNVISCHSNATWEVVSWAKTIRWRVIVVNDRPFRCWRQTDWETSSSRLQTDIVHDLQWCWKVISTASNLLMARS